MQLLLDIVEIENFKVQLFSIGYFKIGTRANPNWTQQSVLPVAPTTQRPLSADALTQKSTETVFPRYLKHFEMKIKIYKM